MRRQPDAPILMLVENNRYPGDPRVYREATALRDAGYQVAVIAPAGKTQRLREVVEGVEVYRFPAPPSGEGLLGYLLEYGYSTAAAFALSLWAHFRTGFDVLHAANPPDTFFLVAAPYKLFGKKFVFDHHDLAPEMYEARFPGKGKRVVRRVLEGLEKLSCKLADLVIATNQSYKVVEMERGGVPEDRITIVRNGPDMARFQRPEPIPGLREEGKTIIAFAGVMGYQDGVDYLLRALHHLMRDLNRSDFLCLLIGGEGAARADLKAMTQELGLEDHVRFTGWVSDEDWVRYLATADICVAPDPSNPFADRSTMIKVMEYMAAGKPIVAFDLPEHRYTAQDAATYARPNDEAAMARAIAHLMDNPAMREEMGLRGKRRGQAELDWRFSAQRLVAAYDRLLAGKAAKGAEQISSLSEPGSREEGVDAA